MTQEQIKLIEHAFSKSDILVFCIGDRVFITEEDILKHKKEATIELTECSEVDESCFNSDGTYDGDCLPGLYTIILQDHLSELDTAVETRYYEDEVVEIHKLHSK